MFLTLVAATLVGLLVVAAIAARLIGLVDFPILKSPDQSLPAYEAIPALLTPAERSFFGALRQAVGDDYHIFAKVRLADIIRPVQGPSRSGWQAALNRIVGKHVDFVLCDVACLKVVGVIELDDKTHRRFERGLRDAAVDAALANACIPIVRIPARASYSPAQLREQVLRGVHAGQMDGADKRTQAA